MPAEQANDLAPLGPDEPADRWIRAGRRILSGQGDDALRQTAVTHFVQRLADGTGPARERVELGEILGWLGDPRLRKPSDADYWVTVDGPEDTVVLGRYPVTNDEFGTWAGGSGYRNDAVWTDEGRAWRNATTQNWPARAADSALKRYFVPNQPVVGVTAFEADAYAAAHAARLPRVDERVFAMRGVAKRPYPWGQPFGDGNANTREEVIGRPCAVGLYLRDQTPEGICDLAGNVAEWTQDGVAGSRLVHPGAWDMPSMAAWAKALTVEGPHKATTSLGFRLARDV